MTKEIIFVYNANSSLFSVASDYVHKIVSPNTYQCNLCKITYGNFGMNKEWSKYVESLGKVRFLHRDEFLREFPGFKKVELPAVFTYTHKLQKLVTAEEINTQKTIKDLIKLLNDKLSSSSLLGD